MYRVSYAPDPPQHSVDYTSEQFACHDRRLARLDEIRRRECTDLVIQDAADLLCAHLVVRGGNDEWRGSPGLIDESTTDGPMALAHLTEHALCFHLALDLTPVHERSVSPVEFEARITSWTTGILYGLRQRDGTTTPVVSRRLNLCCFFGQAELEFLRASGYPGLHVLRAHRLTSDGGHEVLRTVLID